MENICIPMHLDAFALSPSCCDGKSHIAPYTQPNYTALRLDSHLIQHDVLDHVDFHNTSPASKNARLADLGAKAPNNLKPNRTGVHVHWSLPRLYRSGAASTTDKTPKTGTDEPSNPVFPKIPNRWLVTRHIRNRQPTDPLPEFQSWVVESDAVRNLTEIGDDVDLESDVAPFVSYDGDPSSAGVLNQQSEVFLGQKFDLVGWKEASAVVHRPLTLMNSSNPLFADYALHNTNVLSVLDNFSFKKNPGDKTFQYATNVKCDYFVIGWHQDANDDPLNPNTGSDLTSRLSGMILQLDAASKKDFGDMVDGTRCLIYGAIYDVKFDINSKPESVADKTAANFTKNVKMEPLSVGTTPLDSILTFLSAHETDADAIFNTAPGTGNSLAEDITGLAQFLYATSDQYDARVQAQDLMAHQSFAKADGGFQWTFSKESLGGAPLQPTTDDIQTLRKLNEAQTKLDASLRKLRSLRWELFGEWWKYVSEYIPDSKKLDRQAFYQPIVSAITEAIWGQDKNFGLLKTVTSLQDQITSLKSNSFSSSVKQPFFMRTDPTLCIAGVDSGRPQDFLDLLNVVLDHELVAPVAPVSAIFTGATNPVPVDHGLQTTATKLLAQCLANANTTNGSDGIPQTTGYQMWNNKNPFVPLFVEWESMYYHVDINKWDIQLQSTPWGHNHSFVRYVPSSMLSSDSSNQTDIRTLSGRILVLPQPVFSLENVVNSILDNPPTGMTLADGEKDFIKANIRDLKFISAPLSGLTSHLLTRCEGAHVKPVVRVQGKPIQPLAIAAAASAAIGITSDVLSLVDAESALTPYGDLMTFGTDLYPKDKNPFKPVTHGQMLFTKMNIVDKFGQAICLPSPRPRLRNEPHPPDSKIYPCISDYLAPDVIGNTVNTVFPNGDLVQANQIPPCEYIQLPPSINQETRINAAFLTRDTISAGKYSAWREATEYENPVWGWIVINYADGGLQFFLADGTFYREIRIGGPDAANVSSKWLPNNPPAREPTDAATAQLDQLIAQLSPGVDSNASYLQTFSDMINGSILNMPFPPSEYAGYANAIVGKPLALVNAGWSLELAAPAIKPQNSLGNRTTNAQADLEAYSFPLKIGDIERAYDGVVGYYMSSNDPVAPTTDWGKLFTYFLPVPHPKFQDITQPSKTILPNLHPYFLDPATPDITTAHAAKYTVTSLLIDPYTAIHGFSPILPTKSLTLPPWAIQTAFQKMHAFFHLGPNLYVHDVPRTLGEASAAGASIKVPVSGNKGDWTWFQPYVVDDETQLDPQFALMQVQEDMVGEKWGKGPYTFLEGYLQLMGNLQGKSK